MEPARLSQAWQTLVVTLLMWSSAVRKDTLSPGHHSPSATATTRDAIEGKGPQKPLRRSQRRLDRRLEEVAKAVGGGYCRLQMPVRLALAVSETVAGHKWGALEGGRYPPV